MTNGSARLEGQRLFLNRKSLKRFFDKQELERGAAEPVAPTQGQKFPISEEFGARDGPVEGSDVGVGACVF
jgi:hypothetical protein